MLGERRAGRLSRRAGTSSAARPASSRASAAGWSGLRAWARGRARGGGAASASEDRRERRCAAPPTPRRCCAWSSCSPARSTRSPARRRGPSGSSGCATVVDQWIGRRARPRGGARGRSPTSAASARVAARARVAGGRAGARGALRVGAPAARAARGGGVHVGALDAMAGLPFRVVAIPGLVEGGYPGVFRPDPFLLDAEREALRREAPAARPAPSARGARRTSRAELVARPARALRRPEPQPATADGSARAAPRQRAAAAARAAHRPGPAARGAPPLPPRDRPGQRAAVLSYPRADARTGRERLPSLFFAAAASALAGRPLAGAELERLVAEDDLDRLAARGRARRRRARPRAPARGTRPRPTAIAAGSPFFRQSRLASQARWSGRLTRYDGLLTRARRGDPRAPRPAPAPASRSRRAASPPTRAAASCTCSSTCCASSRRPSPRSAGGSSPSSAATSSTTSPSASCASGATGASCRCGTRRRGARAARARWPRRRSSGSSQGSPPRFPLLWEREKRRFHETMQGWLGREARGRRALDARALRGELRPRPLAATRASRTTPSRSTIDLGDGRRAARRAARSTASTAARGRRSSCATTRRAARRATTAASSAAASSSRSRSTSWPRRKLFPGERVVDGLPRLRGRRAAGRLRPELVDGPRVHGAPARASWTLVGRGVFVAGALGLRLLRLHRGLRAQGPAAAPAGATSCATARCRSTCGCGTSRERPFRARLADEDARERARRDHATSLVIEAGAGTGQDDAARRPHRGDRALGPRAARRDRGRDLHRERGHHDEAAPARAARAGARRRAAPGRASASGRRAPSTCSSARPSPPSTPSAPQILQERPLECGVLPGFRMADEAQADALFAEAWEEWLGERLGGGDDVLLDALDRGIPLEGEGPWGERTVAARPRAHARRPARPRAARARRRRSTPTAWRASCSRRARARRELARRGAARATRSAARLERPRRLRGGGALPRGPRARRAPARGSRRSRRTSASSRTGPRRRRSPRGARSRAWTKEARAAWTAARGRRPPRPPRARAARRRRDLRAARRRERGVLDFLDLLREGARRAARPRRRCARYFRRASAS